MNIEHTCNPHYPPPPHPPPPLLRSLPWSLLSTLPPPQNLPLNRLNLLLNLSPLCLLQSAVAGLLLNLMGPLKDPLMTMMMNPQLLHPKMGKYIYHCLYILHYLYIYYCF